MKQIIIFGVVALIGAVGIGYYLNFGQETNSVQAETARKPLYWVAPMDPNFRRDEPGKSPMGMDLVPVYADSESDSGVVRISPAVEHNIGIRTAPARVGHLEDDLTAVAYVQFDERGIWHAYPRVEGWIDRLYVDTVGEEVQQDDPLYDIYAPMLVNAQEEFVSALGSRNQALIDSSAERLQSLGVPASLVRELQKTGKVKQSITVRAPQDGVISELNVRDGHFVTPGTEILGIAALKNVWLTAEIFERDAGRVKLGSEIEARFEALSGEIRLSSVDFISPVIDAVSRTLQVRASLPNLDGALKPNMFARARLRLATGAEAILVPRDSLIRTQTQDRVVLSLGDGAYKSVAVKPGRFGTNEVEILEGLQASDNIVTSAQFLIDSESSVSSDFRRMDLAQVDHGTMDHGTMDHGTMDHGTMDHGAMDTEDSPGVWVTGKIRSIDVDSRTINLWHEPIPAWNWPAMIMTMDAGEDLDLQKLQLDTTYRLHLVQAPEASTGYVVKHAVPADASP